MPLNFRFYFRDHVLRYLISIERSVNLEYMALLYSSDKEIGTTNNYFKSMLSKMYLLRYLIPSVSYFELLSMLSNENTSIIRSSNLVTATFQTNV